MPLTRKKEHRTGSSDLPQHRAASWRSNLGGLLGGSTFFFTLPVLQGEKPDPTAKASGPLVLVCDDDPSIRAVVQTMLEQQATRQ